MYKQRIELANKLFKVIDKDPKVLIDLIEAKHLAYHGGAPHREVWISKHHKRYPDKKEEKEKKKTKQAVLAAAALAYLIASSNKRLISNMFRAANLLAKMKDANIRQQAQFRARFNAEIEASKKFLSDAYRKSYMYGLQSTGLPVRFGAPKSLSKKEKDWLDNGLKQELKFFDGLVSEVKKGRSVSALVPRIRMYSDALTSAYSAGQVIGSDPETLIHWNLDPNARHCLDCIEISKESPFTKDTLPTQPKSGWCQCKSNCKCTLSFELAGKDTVEKIRNTAKPMSYWKAKLLGVKKNSR
ncbi:MAG: hypothetical protein ACO3L1_00145 [Flavobacteriaceae bacterium]